MSKRGDYEMRTQEAGDRPKVHPIWRGVGFVMMILIPIVSYAATEVLIQQNTKAPFFPWPTDLIARPGDFLYNGDPLLYFKILITITFMLILYALFTLITFLLNSAFGSPRYGPYDLPPIKGRVRKRAR
jgi:hypothetical protein